MVQTIEEYFKSHNAKKVIFHIGPKEIRLTKDGFRENVTEDRWKEIPSNYLIEENVDRGESGIKTPVLDASNITKAIIY